MNKSGIIKRCEYCEAEFFASKYVITRRRFCSDACQKKAYQESNGRRFSYVCKRCGREYTTAYKNRDQYCSRDCAYEDIQKWHAGNQIQQVMKQCLSCWQIFLAAPTSSKNYCSDECCNNKSLLVCHICGGEFRGRSDTKYCTDSCRVEAIRDMSRQYAADQYEPPTIYCEECGIEFSPEYGDKRRVYCSDGCAKKYASRIEKSKRRAKEKKTQVESINPYKVFRRARWHCYICGGKTPKENRGTHAPDAPELDHIIPLSRGGTHTYDNVACACRRCNHGKADLSLDEFVPKTSMANDGVC